MKESRWSFAESRRRRAPLALLLCVTLSGILPFATPGVARAAAPGVDGALTVSAAGTVVNLYTQLVSASGRTVVVSSISQLENAALGNVGPGSVLLLYQATGATINTSNASPAPATYGGGVYGTVTAAGGAGNYEFVTVASVSGNTITLASSCATLLHAYTSSAQVVRVPQYSSVTVAAGGSITGLAWNGATGGVIAMNVSGALTLNNTSGSIVATGIGFRGATGYANAGTSSNSTYLGTVFNYVFSGETGDNLSTALGGVKGEGVAGGGSDYGTIYDTNDVSRYGRGAPANGGGGGDGHNSGGGGGANYGASGAAWYGAGLEDTAYDAYYSNANAENPSRAADPGYNGMIASANAKGGGRGGYSFGYSGAFYPNGDDGRRPVGGLGGHPLTSSAAPATSVAYMGGGGGSGDSNGGDTQNGYSFTSSGGNGGGLVLINVGTSGTTGSISGSGTIVSQGAAGNGSSEDGAGGGGAGGSVVVVLGSSGTGKVAGINVAGGAGGTETNPSGNEEAEGPGGGGQGGYISAPVTTATITGGVEGTTPQAPLSVTSMGASNTGASPGFLAYGATQGTTGYSDTAQTTIANACQSPVLGAVKSSTVVSNGDRSYTATYTVLLQNYGDSALGSVTASDVLSTTFPSPATYSIAAAPTVSATSGGATATASTTYDGYSSAANELLITTGTMPIGSTITITFKVKFLPNANGSLTYNNQVTANASGTSGTANGIATSYLSNDGNSPCATTASPEDGYGTTTCGNAVTPVTVIGEPTIQKTVQNLTTGEASGLTADTAKPGNTLQYTLSFTNTTGGTLTGVSFKDSVPANTTYVSSACGSLATGITACSATYTPPVVGPPAVAGYVTWTLTGTMANSATQTVTMNVTVN